MNSIRELVSTTRKRPAMYIGGNSISNLKAFIDGWRYRDPTTIADYEILVSFQKWIEDKYRIKTAHSWGHILLFFALDESRALELFLKEFESFLSEKKL